MRKTEAKRFVSIRKINNRGGYKYGVFTNIYYPQVSLFGNTTMWAQYKSKKPAIKVATFLRSISGLRIKKYVRKIISRRSK